MNLKEMLKNKIQSKKYKEVTIFDDIKVLCARQTIKSIEELQTKLKDSQDNAEIAKYLSKQFVDPEDKKPVFTAVELLEEVPNEEVQELTKVFFKANGADIELKEIEKNSESQGGSTNSN